MHLCLVKFILKIQRLLNEFQLYQRWHDLAARKLLCSDDFDHFASAFLNSCCTCFENLLVSNYAFEFSQGSGDLNLEKVNLLSKLFDLIMTIIKAFIQWTLTLFLKLFHHSLDLLDIFWHQRRLYVLSHLFNKVHFFENGRLGLLCSLLQMLLQLCRDHVLRLCDLLLNHLVNLGKNNLVSVLEYLFMHLCFEFIKLVVQVILGDESIEKYWVDSWRRIVFWRRKQSIAWGLIWFFFYCFAFFDFIRGLHLRLLLLICWLRNRRWFNFVLFDDLIKSLICMVSKTWYCWILRLRYCLLVWSYLSHSSVRGRHCLLVRSYLCHSSMLGRHCLLVRGYLCHSSMLGCIHGSRWCYLLRL